MPCVVLVLETALGMAAALEKELICVQLPLAVFLGGGLKKSQLLWKASSDMRLAFLCPHRAALAVIKESMS
eukprot:1152582-Pelagomonas_calceolata.AAC.4